MEFCSFQVAGRRGQVPPGQPTTKSRQNRTQCGAVSVQPLAGIHRSAKLRSRHRLDSVCFFRDFRKRAAGQNPHVKERPRTPPANQHHKHRHPAGCQPANFYVLYTFIHICRVKFSGIRDPMRRGWTGGLNSGIRVGAATGSLNPDRAFGFRRAASFLSQLPVVNRPINQRDSPSPPTRVAGSFTDADAATPLEKERRNISGVHIARRAWGYWPGIGAKSVSSMAVCPRVSR